MSNLARDFARLAARRDLEGATKENFEYLKDIALRMFDQNVALQEMLEQYMRESLGLEN